MTRVQVTIVLLGLAGASQPRMPMMHEISTRPWLYSLAQSGMTAQCGGGEYVCLKDVPRSEWQRFADMKVEVLWLMGVWQLGEYGPALDKTHIDNFRGDLPDVQQDDIIGSPYSIQEYKVNADIGTDADLAEVRKVLNSMGVKLMVDFVPNHGAVDSMFAAQNPDVFLQKPADYQGHSDWWINREGHTFAYGRGPYDGPWTDTIQYNYWNPKAVEVLKNVLVSIASKADAIRCDMAHLILNDVFKVSWDNSGVMPGDGFKRPGAEFWQVAISAVRAQYPDTIFLAEAYNYNLASKPEKELLQDLGFDYVYDKTVLDKLIAGNLDDLRQYIRSESEDFFSRTAHFVENHDEKRAAFNLHGQQSAFAGSVVAFTLPGMRFSFEGQFEGFSKKLDVQLRRETKESPNADLEKQYHRLLSIVSDDVFHTGKWTFIDTPTDASSWRVTAWRWSSTDGRKKRLIVVNFSDQEAWANVAVADAGNGSSDDITITELLSGKAYLRSASKMRSSGLTCGLQPFTAQIFSYDSASAQSVVV
jgi:glycosidase